MKKERTGIRIGDWWLLGLFTILIVQSVYGLFFPLPEDNGVESIDIVFRTSEAAIFGYIISGNFGRRQSSTSQATEQTDLSTDVVPSIGFDTQETSPTASAQVGKRTALTEPPTAVSKPKKNRPKRKNTHQLTLVGIIGIISLLVLIAWRNTYGANGLATTSMIAVITQYRDMVSGCVGFLIGQPQVADSAESDV